MAIEQQSKQINELSTTACDPSGKQVDRRTIRVEQIHIPDLWHTADWLREEGFNEAAENVLNVWHLAHDLRDKMLRLNDETGERPDHDGSADRGEEAAAAYNQQ